MHPINRLLSILLLTSLAVLLQACGPDTATTREQEVKEPLDQGAQLLFNNGDFAAAAEEYLKLSRLKDGSAIPDYSLYAAEALLETGQTDRAYSLLQGLKLKTDEPAHQWQQLLQARLDLAGNKTSAAIAILGQVNPSGLSPRLQASLYRTEAQAYDNLGNVIESNRSRIKLGELLISEDDRLENRQRIWESINRLNGNVLQQLLPADRDQLRGWMELALLAKVQMNDASTFTQKLNQWQTDYPGHPGQIEIVEELSRNSLILDIKPSHIAVLLPFNGRYSAAAAAVRDGLIAAWYEDDGKRPDLQFFDANVANISSVYQQAIDAGADMIVGPLEKDAVSALQSLGTLPAITLALNQSSSEEAVPPATESGLYQLALSPEDEARQIAERAWFDGHLSALLITPEGAWGERIHSAFLQRWSELGGQISDHRQYVNTSNDFSTPVKQLLNIDSSEQRARQLRQTLGKKLSFEPRIRRDADFVFIAAYPQTGRQIRPQLLFHNAGHLPVYATSNIYAGQVNAEKDQDLNGVIFSDMPWLLDPLVKQSELYQTISRNWPQAGSSSRLFALGIDAYNLIPQLGRLLLQPFTRYRGSSGTLSMRPDGILNRQLQWAMFINGEPQSLDAVRVVE